MRRFIRLAALLFLFGSIGVYLWHGISGQGGEVDPAFAWVGPLMALPIVAVTIVPLALVFTSETVLNALTGRNSTEFRDAPLGIATLRAMHPTRMSVNEQPVMRLELTVFPADGPAFDSEAKMVVRLTELGSLRPGVQVPVRYLPGRTDKVEVDRSEDTGQVQAAMNRTMIRQGVTTQSNIDIAERGVTAQAVVQSLNVPGDIRDGNALLMIGLAVTRPDGSVFRTEVAKYLPRPAVPFVQVGNVVTVHYLPHDEHEVVLSLPANAWTMSI